MQQCKSGVVVSVPAKRAFIKLRLDTWMLEYLQRHRYALYESSAAYLRQQPKYFDRDKIITSSEQSYDKIKWLDVWSCSAAIVGIEPQLNFPDEAF